MSRAAPAGLPWLAALLAVFLATSAGAHTRSQSFSRWDVRGGLVTAVVSVPAVDVTRIATGPEEAADLAGLLRARLGAGLSVSRGGAPCAAAVPRSLAARTGYLRIELRFACPGEGAIEVADQAFFDVVPSHVHYARFETDDGTQLEEIFTDGRRVHTIAGRDSGTSDTGASFVTYVLLGIEHIAAGADHVAFLLALLLLCRRLRDVLLLVTGFTIGHSITLTLAVLGVVRPDVPVVEALIGFTIALVAAENVAVQAHEQRALALVAAAGLVALAAARAFFGAGLPVATALGLALFVLCYFPLERDRDDAVRMRPLLTLVFGLVHGFGFASVLMAIGLPADRLASSLFGFNLGVEIGQLAIVAALWLAGLVLARRVAGLAQPRLVSDALSAALCALGLFWFVSRALAI